MYKACVSVGKTAYGAQAAVMKTAETALISSEVPGGAMDIYLGWALPDEVAGQQQSEPGLVLVCGAVHCYCQCREPRNEAEADFWSSYTSLW